MILWNENHIYFKSNNSKLLQVACVEGKKRTGKFGFKQKKRQYLPLFFNN